MWDVCVPVAVVWCYDSSVCGIAAQAQSALVASLQQTVAALTELVEAAARGGARVDPAALEALRAFR